MDASVSTPPRGESIGLAMGRDCPLDEETRTHPPEAPWTTGRCGTLSLRGSQCQLCGAAAFPPRPACPWCGHRSVSDIELGSRGVLYSFTEVHVGRPPFPQQYTLGLVDMPHGVRLLAQVDHAGPLSSGIDVEAYLGPITNGDARATLGYRFRRTQGEPR